MKNIINSTKTLSNLNEIDFYYKQLMSEFFITLKPSYNRVNITLVLSQLYETCREDALLISKKDGSLLISKLTIEHILKYQHKIEIRVNKNEISKKYANALVFYVRMFCKFLTNKKLVNLFFKPINFLKSHPKNRPKQIYPLLSDFIRFLDSKNYSRTNKYEKNVKKFLEFSDYKNTKVYNENFWEAQIKKYEEVLRTEVIKESLAHSSAYKYLRDIRIFYTFLYEEKIISFKYKIPLSFRVKSNRNNEFVPVKDILILLNKILEKSKNTLRDISIFLIILETGCRPIEVVNLEISDVVLAERLLILKSKKSHQRTLKVSSELMYFIKEYLKIRQNYLTDTNTKSLFLNRNGTPISTSTIYGSFRWNNLSAFGSINFSPKSLRHTFITNALNNKNDIEEVAKIVGHKNLSITMGYFYRNIESIKQIIIGKELNLGKVEL